jgi:hypothetical protein
MFKAVRAETIATAMFKAARAEIVVIAEAVMHLFELGILFRCQHRLIGVVAFCQEGLHLFLFLPGQEVIVVMDRLDLAVQVFLTCFEFGELVVGKVEPQLQTFEAGGFHDLAVLVHSFLSCREQVPLPGREEGGEFVLFLFIKG